MPTARQTVYEAVDSERAYQDAKWGNKFHSMEEWMVYMEDYLREMKESLAREPENVCYPKARDTMRKITAMGVCCLEQHGVSKRKE